MARSAQPRGPKSGRRRALVLSAVRPVVSRLSEAQGLVVWDVAFAREAGDDVLRIALDRRGGVDSDRIAKFAEALSRELDVLDAVPGDARYLLEVTSPGAERRLRTAGQFAVCAGRTARVTFRSGREPLEGVIGEVTADAVEIGGESVAYEDMSQARLMVQAGPPSRRTAGQGVV